MKTYTLLAPAKINLFLEILGDRPDGFHELVMVLQSIALKDKIQIRANGTEQIRLFCSHSLLPTDRQNLAYRAAQLMQSSFPQAYARYGGVDLELEKNIPIAAGLAGGSTDAAAVLVGLDLLWELGLTLPELQTLAAQLGSDVPFCLAGGTALATGRGEKLDPLPDVAPLWILLAKYQSLEVSTPWAYQAYRQQFGHQYLPLGPATLSRTKEIHAGPLIQAILHQDTAQIARSVHNDLEKVVLPHYPQVAQLRELMAATGGMATLMSGSGPTVFCLCTSQVEAQNLQSRVRQKLPHSDLGLWIAPLCSHGIQVL